MSALRSIYFKTYAENCSHTYKGGRISMNVNFEYICTDDLIVVNHHFCSVVSQTRVLLNISCSNKLNSYSFVRALLNKGKTTQRNILLPIVFKGESSPPEHCI